MYADTPADGHRGPGENRPKRQDEVLAYVRRRVVQNGRSPTIRDIGRDLGISSTSVVNYYLNKLARRGLLIRHPNIACGIELPDALTLFIGDEVLGETEDGRLVRVRVVEPVPAAAAA